MPLGQPRCIHGLPRAAPQSAPPTVGSDGRIQGRSSLASLASAANQRHTPRWLVRSPRLPPHGRQAGRQSWALPWRPSPLGARLNIHRATTSPRSKNSSARPSTRPAVDGLVRLRSRGAAARAYADGRRHRLLHPPPRRPVPSLPPPPLPSSRVRQGTPLRSRSRRQRERRVCARRGGLGQRLGSGRPGWSSNGASPSARGLALWGVRRRRRRRQRYLRG